jgi:hypothetical protein
MAQQEPIPVKLVGPDGVELPMPGYALIRKDCLDLFAEILAAARGVRKYYEEYKTAIKTKGPAFYAGEPSMPAGTYKAGDNLVMAAGRIVEPLAKLDEVERHLAAVGDKCAVDTLEPSSPERVSLEE